VACFNMKYMFDTLSHLYGVITNNVSDYINLLVRIAHIICNHASFLQCTLTCLMRNR
jgi:hypothetical protein